MSIILQTDSYKLTHWKQYPPNTDKVYSYLESRGGMFDSTVFFGLQYYLKKYLAGSVVTPQQVVEGREFCDKHIAPGTFNVEGWNYIANELGGRLPVEVKAVAEGTEVTTHNALLTIENTDPRCYWLTNYLESLLLKVWYPTTVCTLSRELKKTIQQYLEETGDPSLVDFKLHDFGYRGVSSEESAQIGAAAHLVNFLGTDTIAGMALLHDFYDAEPVSGFSIPAAEHSTITAWGKEHEGEAYENMLTQYPEGLVAVVSDSFDIYAAIRNLWGGTLRKRVLERGGVLVIRPDSGDPEEVVLKCLDILAERFGAERNEKGFKVLFPKVRLIQGDGMNFHSLTSILARMAAKGWSADNIAFGMGGALLQQLNRDTQKFAFKASNITIAGVDRDVFKEPVTDSGKNSKRGRLALVQTGNIFSTLKLNPEVGCPYDLLEPVFRNGEVLRSQTFKHIRERAKG